ncbi:MAG: DUF4443 domain-containing protein [Candidatus Methanomethylicia archaeon]
MVPDIKILSVIRSLCEKRADKVPPLFNEYHVLKTLLILQQRSASRELLARELRIGEGSIRTLIGKLNKYGLISTCRRYGCSLTDSGKQIIDEFKKIVPKVVLNIDLRKLRLGYFNAGLLIRGLPIYNKSGTILRIRDLVIRNGGDAALILQVTINGVIIPPMGVDDSVYEDLRRIKKALNPDQDDLIIISFAQTLYAAEKSLLMTLITFLNDSVKTYK